MNHFHLLFVSRTLLAMLTATILLSSLCGCASMPTSKQRSEIENNIDRITAKTCQKEMVSFLDLGPRPSWKKEAISQAQNYLEARLRQMDYQVEREPLPGLLYESRGNANIIAEKTGTRFPDQILEISAHFDSLDNMGADDNASGVIGVLEIARILKNLNCERTIRFCLFDCEEVGLVGSEHHVTRILKDSNRKVIGLINLEMIGYSSSAPDSQMAPVRIPLIVDLPRTGDFILVAGNFSSGWLGNRIERHIELFEPNLPYYSANRIAGFFSDAARSDHSPYWAEGLDAIMLTDTANFRNPHYHKKTDTLETLDFEFMAQITRAVAATALHWAGIAEASVSQLRDSGQLYGPVDQLKEPERKSISLTKTTDG